MRYPAIRFSAVIISFSMNAIEGLLTGDPLTGKIMGIGNGIWHAILFLIIISSFIIFLPEAKGGCSGGCSISGGGGVSSGSFMGDRAVDIEMSSFDEFVRDKLGRNPAAALQAKTPSRDFQLSSKLSSNSSLNQTGKSNSSENSSAVVISSNNRTVKLAAIGTQSSRLSDMAFAAFSNNWL